MIDQEIISYIHSCKTVAIATHVNPDGDAIGSAVALCHGLRSLGKDASAYFLRELPDRYKFMFAAELCRIGLDELPEKCDALICVDCASAERLGHMRDRFSRFEKVINIDHHVTNTEYGDMNYAVKCAATGEIITELLQELNVKFDSSISNALYASIITDTGRFSYEDTNTSTFAKVSYLYDHCLDIPYVTNCIYAGRSLGATKLISVFTQNIEMFYDGKVSFTHVFLSDLAKYGCDASDCENAIDFAREIAGVNVAVFMRELSENYYKISFRSKTDSIDVAEIASVFDGGGHSKAAGCSLRGEYYALQEKILKLLGDYI